MKRGYCRVTPWQWRAAAARRYAGSLSSSSSSEAHLYAQREIVSDEAHLHHGRGDLPEFAVMGGQGACNQVVTGGGQGKMGSHAALIGMLSQQGIGFNPAFGVV